MIRMALMVTGAGIGSVAPESALGAASVASLNRLCRAITVRASRSYDLGVIPRSCCGRSERPAIISLWGSLTTCWLILAFTSE